MKTCTQCSTEKPYSEFSRRSDSGDGHKNWCKACVRLYMKRRGSRVAPDWLLSKPCIMCKKAKQLNQFYKCSTGQYGLRPECKACSSIMQRTKVLKDSYGMTPSEYKALLASQGGMCDLCHREIENPAVDHDHSTGAVRGILCGWCNMRLAHIENVEFKANAEAYLRKWASRASRAGGAG